MIHPITSANLRALAEGRSVASIRAADSPLATPEILTMLAGLAARIEHQFTPAAWLLVEGGEAVGLCSIKSVDLDGSIDIGYGVAPTRRRRGAATRAVADLVAWARSDPRVRQLTAETMAEPGASPKILLANGFVQIGERVDVEDGRVWCWRRDCSD